MSAERKGSQNLSKSLLESLAIKSGQQTPQFQEISLSVPNHRLRTFKFQSADGPLFVKIYENFPEEGVSEFSNYQYFAGLPFVPKLRYFDLDTSPTHQLLAYEFIEGFDLHSQLSDRREKGILNSIDTIIETIDQAESMAANLVGHESIFNSYPWALTSPIREGYLTEDDHNSFTTSYSLTHLRNRQSIDAFPGYYLDRNPRNILVSGNKTFQIDFGIIEYASPIFDLAKLIRNGVDISRNIRPEHYLELSAFTSMQEEYIKDYFYNTRLKSESTSKEQFDLSFDHAALHTHIFYLTKYLKMIRDKLGDTEVLKSRVIYHEGMSYRTIHDLVNKGEDIENMYEWIEFLAINSEDRNAN